MLGNPAVTTPATALRIFVLVGTQSLENGSRVLKDRRDDVSTLHGLTHAPTANRLHPIVRDHNLASRSENRIDGGNGKVLTARITLFWHNLLTIPDRCR